MSKSKNSRSKDFYEDDFRKVSRKDLRKKHNRRTEKKLESALKSKDLGTLIDIESWKE